MRVSMDTIDEIKTQRRREDKERNKTPKTIWGIRWAALVAFLLSAVFFSIVLMKLRWDEWQSSIIYAVIGVAFIVLGSLIQEWGLKKHKAKVRALYFEKDETPLKWHKFFCWFCLLSILYSSNEATKPFVLGSSWFMLIILIHIVLSVSMLVGMLRFRRYGYVLFFFNFGFLLISAVIISIINDFSTAITVPYSGVLIPWIPTIIYYRKRRLLFGS